MDESQINITGVMNKHLNSNQFLCLINDTAGIGS